MKKQGGNVLFSLYTGKTTKVEKQSDDTMIPASELSDIIKNYNIQISTQHCIPYRRTTRQERRTNNNDRGYEQANT